MKIPFFTVIINNYNYERFIAKAIASVQEQDFKDLELIVVDDGSTDNSLKVIGELLDDSQVISKPNGGQGSAMNVGFHAAKGQWILFLDADDWLYPNALSRIHETLQLRNDVSMLQFRLDVYKNGQFKGTIPGESRPLASGEVYKDLLNYNRYTGPPTSGCFFKADALSTFMPMPEEPYRICADAYLRAQAPFYGNVLGLEISLGVYRIHASNSFAGLRSRMTLNQLKVQHRQNELKREILVKGAMRKGVPFIDERLCRNPQYCVVEILALRIFKNVSIKAQIKLLKNAIFGVASNSRLSSTERFLFLLKIVASFLLPGQYILKD